MSNLSEDKPLTFSHAVNLQDLESPSSVYDELLAMCQPFFFKRILWYDILACLEDSKFCSSPYSSLTFTAILAPLSWIRDCVIDVPLEDEPFQVIDSLHFD